jgi:EAL and modified HD-GYP domain-containing signal transduction protein
MQDVLSLVEMRRYPILNQRKQLMAHSWCIEPKAGDQSHFLDFWQSSAFQAHLRYGKAFVRVPSRWLADEVWLTQTDWSSLVLELSCADYQHSDALRIAKIVRQGGGEIALVNFSGSEECWRMTQVAQYVKLDTAKVTDEEYKRLSQLNIVRIAIHVDSEKKFVQDHQSGCEWFEGYGFTRPLIDPTANMVNRATLLQTLSELNNPKVDLLKLAQVIGYDVALTHQLMTMLNSAAMALPSPVHGLEDAVRFLGTERVSFWANVLLLSNLEDSPSSLLYTALSRAKFMALVAEALAIKQNKDAWFLVGLFSTLDAFLKCDMSQAVAQLPLADEVQDALLHQVGEMGHALAVIFALENDQATLSIALGHLDVCALSKLYVDASAWAYQVWTSQSAPRR